MTTDAFDVCGRLPAGVTVLEASAGTGKTFAIAALAARYVAEGVPLPRMLLVTFTRMATGELRERVRDRLVTAEQGLAGVARGGAGGAGGAGTAVDPADEVLRLLATGSAAEVETRRGRLAAALANFDAATITTTHGFCHQVLAGLGVAGDVDGDANLVEGVDDLVEEVVDDRFLARALGGSVPPFGLREARLVARCAVQNPRTPIVAVGGAAGGDAESPARLRRRLALTVRHEVEDRKRRAHLVTYDDLLGRLADALRAGRSGTAARERLRNRFQVVLVDEFQDTDELQWQILSDAFRAPGSTLVLIGDPKQAIYAFRGADVHAYLDAVATAGRVGTLDVNWRSDQGLVDAYDALLHGATLGHPDIVYRTVRAAAAHQRPGLDGVPAPCPLRLRVVHRGDGDVALTPTGYAQAASARALIAQDLAGDVGRLLSAGADVVARGPDGRETGREHVRPGHVAVLTRRHRDAATVRDALAAAGIPAVINGAGSVFATDAARDWLRLLEALERPASSPRVLAAALTPFVGWTAGDIDAADDTALENLHAAAHHWAALLRRSGVASLLERITRTTEVPSRVLATDGGERRLTDLRHVGQLLHAEATEERLGTSALTAWLRQRLREAGEETGAEERNRRLDTDAEAVQVLTIHRSKGLEFPVVYYPYLWDPAWIPRDGRPVIYHDRDGDERRTIDTAGDGALFEQHRDWQAEEQRGEELRLAYVALTRAKHQAIVWWAGSYDSPDSALGRLLFARDDDGTVRSQGRRTPTDANVVARLEQLSARAPGRIGIERVGRPTGDRVAHPRSAPPRLSAAAFDRSIDRSWGRTSYTGLTANTHEPTVGSEPERPEPADDEILRDDMVTTVTPADVIDDGALRSETVPLADMPGGARVGSFIHAVLESVDFAADDLSAALADAIRTEQARGPTPLGDLDMAVSGLRAAIETPLGPLAGDLRLRDLHSSDRLDELSFELPVAGGDRPGGRVTLAAIGDLLAEHLPADDPLHDYPAHLRDPAVDRAFRGYLTGSLDLVARLPRPDGIPGFAVVDYKTNLLGDDAPLSAWHYRPAALAAAMQRAHYPLQALLYSVALHRYLRWRLADYRPERDLGGVFYLFLRGMSGVAVPRVGGQPCGVFAWQPPSPLVLALSDLLNEGLPDREDAP